MRTSVRTGDAISKSYVESMEWVTAHVTQEEYVKEESMKEADGICCGCGYYGKKQTPCPTRADKIHCECWWDGTDEDVLVSDAVMIPDEVDIPRETLIKLRGLPGKAPEIPFDGDDTL